MKDRKENRPELPMQTDAAPRRSRVRLGRDIQNKIGLQLRAMYDDVVKEGVPDRFSEMLRKLDAPKDSDKGDV
jgi:hypothetical protein